MGKVASAGTPLATSHVLLGLLDTDCDGARILEEEGASVVATLRSALTECPTDPPVVPDT